MQPDLENPRSTSAFPCDRERQALITMETLGYFGPPSGPLSVMKCFQYFSILTPSTGVTDTCFFTGPGRRVPKSQSSCCCCCCCCCYQFSTVQKSLRLSNTQRSTYIHADIALLIFSPSDSILRFAENLLFIWQNNSKKTLSSTINQSNPVNKSISQNSWKGIYMAQFLSIFSSFHWNELMQSRGVRRPSVCPSVCLSVNFAQIASSTRNVTRSPPNLHTMVPRRACIQGVLKVKVKVKGHVIQALFCLH